MRSICEAKSDRFIDKVDWKAEGEQEGGVEVV